MPIVLVISRHTPENCAMFNEKAKKVYIEYWNKLNGRLKKYGGKMLGGYSVHAEHLAIMIFEVPSLEAFQKSSMEPEVMALSRYSTYEVKLAETMEEAMKMIKGK
jgi:uncharacterized protein with GYD domain